MTSDHDPHGDQPDDHRRGSPFDDGFVTLWRNADTAQPRRPAANDAGDARDRDDLLPDVDLGTSDDRRDARLAERLPEEPDEPDDIATAALNDEEAVAEREAARTALRPALRALEATGLYAYITLDEENRWTVASDDDAGRVDIRLEGGAFEVIMSATSPGMYADEEQPYRRRSLERLARMLVPRVSRGYLAEHQQASWDEVEAGISVQVRYLLPRDDPEAIGPFVQEHFAELDELLAFVEEHVSR